MGNFEYEPPDEDPDDVWARVHRRQAAARGIAGLIADGEMRDRVAAVIAGEPLTFLEAEIATYRFAALPTDVRDKIVRLRAALDTVQELSGDPHVMAEICRHWAQDVPWRIRHHLTKAVIESAPAWSQALTASADSLTGKGVPRVSPNFHGVRGEWFCAAYATLLWRAARLDPPAPDGKRFAALCASLWREAGGNDEPKWGHWGKAVEHSELANDQDFQRYWLVEHGERIANGLEQSL